MHPPRAREVMRTRVPKSLVSSSARARTWTSLAVLVAGRFDGRQLQSILRSGIPNDDRDRLEVGALGRLETAFAGDQLEAAGDAADDERLEEPVTTDRLGQRGERLLVEVPPRLVGVRHDLAHRH